MMIKLISIPRKITNLLAYSLTTRQRKRRQKKLNSQKKYLNFKAKQIQIHPKHIPQFLKTKQSIIQQIKQQTIDPYRSMRQMAQQLYYSKLNINVPSVPHQQKQEQSQDKDILYNAIKSKSFQQTKVLNIIAQTPQQAKDFQFKVLAFITLNKLNYYRPSQYCQELLAQNLSQLKHQQPQQLNSALHPFMYLLPNNIFQYNLPYLNMSYFEVNDSYNFLNYILENNIQMQEIKKYLIMNLIREAKKLPIEHCTRILLQKDIPFYNQLLTVLIPQIQANITQIPIEHFPYLYHHFQPLLSSIQLVRSVDKLSWLVLNQIVSNLVRKGIYSVIMRQKVGIKVMAGLKNAIDNGLQVIGDTQKEYLVIQEIIKFLWWYSNLSYNQPIESYKLTVVISFYKYLQQVNLPITIDYLQSLLYLNYHGLLPFNMPILDGQLSQNPQLCEVQILIVTKGILKDKDNYYGVFKNKVIVIGNRLSKYLKRYADVAISKEQFYKNVREKEIKVQSLLKVSRVQIQSKLKDIRGQTLKQVMQQEYQSGDKYFLSE